MSIHNDTEVILNIALSQVGPLYYQNFVKPGECVTFDVGKVWFTIDGRVWNGDNDYDGKEVARSIIECTLEAVALFMIVFGSGRNAITSGRVDETFYQAMSEVKLFGKRQNVCEKLTQAISEVKHAHESEIMKKLMRRIFNGNAIHSPGWYVGNDRRISISGGPKYVSVDNGKEIMFHKIDVDTLNNPFVINDK